MTKQSELWAEEEIKRSAIRARVGAILRGCSYLVIFRAPRIPGSSDPHIMPGLPPSLETLDPRGPPRVIKDRRAPGSNETCRQIKFIRHRGAANRDTSIRLTVENAYHETPWKMRTPSSSTSGSSFSLSPFPWPTVVLSSIAREWPRRQLY